MQRINKHVHWRTLKTQNMKSISFCIQKILSLLLQIKTDGNDTLLLSIPKTGVLKTLATTGNTLLVYYVLHVASPRINEAEAKYSITSHVASKYTSIKKHSSYSFIALLFRPRLSEYERSDAMLKAGVRVFDVARYHNCHLSTKQHLRDRYQATQVWSAKNGDRR